MQKRIHTRILTNAFDEDYLYMLVATALGNELATFTGGICGIIYPNPATFVHPIKHIIKS